MRHLFHNGHQVKALLESLRTKMAMRRKTEFSQNPSQHLSRPKWEPDSHPGEIFLKRHPNNYQVSNHRKLFLMRHGERLDFTVGPWIKYCFDQHGTYTCKDLNMPETVPVRSGGPNSYARDTPITRIGMFQAQCLGRALRENGIDIDNVYVSPAFRSIQTAEAFLQGFSGTTDLKMRIEGAFFEWTAWYKDQMAEFLTIEELTAAGYHIDLGYKPVVGITQLRSLQETCEEFYARHKNATDGILKAHPTTNTIIVGHATTLDASSRGLTGGNPRDSEGLKRMTQNIPYSALVQLEEVGHNWRFVEPVFSSMTHTSNRRFNYEELLI